MVQNEYIPDEQVNRETYSERDCIGRLVDKYMVECRQ